MSADKNGITGRALRTVLNIVTLASVLVAATLFIAQTHSAAIAANERGQRAITTAVEESVSRQRIDDQHDTRLRSLEQTIPRIDEKLAAIKDMIDRHMNERKNP